MARGSSAATLNSALNPALNSTLVLRCYSTENSTELSRSMSQILSKNDDFFKNLGKKMLIFQILTKNDDFSNFDKFYYTNIILHKYSTT